MSFTIKTRVISGDMLTLTEAKNYLRVQHSQDDTYITELIKTATYLLGEYLQRSVLNTTYTVIFSPSLKLYLPYPQVSSITSVKIDEQVTTDYTVSLADGSITFPSLHTGDIQVTYDTVPSDGYSTPLKQYTLNIIGMLYEHRSTSADLSTVAGLNKLKYYTLW